MHRLPLVVLASFLGTSVAGCGDAPPGTVPPSVRPDAGSRGALSATLREALDARDLAAAEAALLLLQRDHAGEGEMPDGRTLSPAAMSGAVSEAAAAEARRAIEGPAPDRARAERALAVAARHAPDDEAGAAPLAAARRWVALASLADVRTPLAAHAGARVLAVADDFDLGEVALVRALRRWRADVAAEGLRVGVVPMYRGWIRVGIRRTRARDRDEERRSVDARLAGTDVAVEPEPADADVLASDLGLTGQDAAVLVFDRAGRLVGRLSGRNLDPSVLDAVVQRAASR